MRKGNEVEIFAARDEITEQLNDVNSATAILPLPRMISYDLKFDSTLDESIHQNLEKISIREEDEAEDSEAMSFRHSRRSQYRWAVAGEG